MKWRAPSRCDAAAAARQAVASKVTGNLLGNCDDSRLRQRSIFKNCGFMGYFQRCTGRPFLAISAQLSAGRQQDPAGNVLSRAA
jgi:hypothetical protein